MAVRNDPLEGPVDSRDVPALLAVFLIVFAFFGLMTVDERVERKAGAPVNAEEAALWAVRCPGPAFGVEFAVFEAPCPDPQEATSVLLSAVDRVHVSPDVLSGMRVVLTKRPLRCAGEPAFGCTRDLSVSVIRVKYGYLASLVHEAGHYVKARTSFTLDLSHRDRAFWHALEPFESAWSDEEDRRQEDFLPPSKRLDYWH